jgi:hypothetical protein
MERKERGDLPQLLNKDGERAERQGAKYTAKTGVELAPPAFGLRSLQAIRHVRTEYSLSPQCTTCVGLSRATRVAVSVTPGREDANIPKQLDVQLLLLERTSRGRERRTWKPWKGCDSSIACNRTHGTACAHRFSSLTNYLL